MDRKAFWDWMATCPAKENGDDSGWFIAKDEGTDMRVFFYFETKDED